MILLNTTIACDPALAEEVKRWIGDIYLPAVREAGCFRAVTASSVRPVGGADAASLAVQLRCASDADADRWLAGKGGELLGSLADGRRDRILYFHTFLDIIHDSDL